MKQLIILASLSILMNLSLVGQNFISPDKQWNVRLTGWPNTLTTEIYTIDGDSIVNSLLYSKIWASLDSLSSWQFQGLLREESNIVYYLPTNGNEGILYDFNLEIGDTAYVNNIFCSNIPIYVVDIDTVEYFGIDRKRWLLGEDGYPQESWLEGIGSLYGPLHTKYEYCLVCPIWELLCYHNNAVLEYIMEGETECFQQQVGIDELAGTNKITLSPNPVKKGNAIQIETNFIPAKVDLVNSSGIMVHSLPATNDHTMKIETNDLQAGLYLVRITNQDNLINTIKIIILPR